MSLPNIDQAPTVLPAPTPSYAELSPGGLNLAVIFDQNLVEQALDGTTWIARLNGLLYRVIAGNSSGNTCLFAIALEGPDHQQDVLIYSADANDVIGDGTMTPAIAFRLDHDIKSV